LEKIGLDFIRSKTAVYKLEWLEWWKLGLVVVDRQVLGVLILLAIRMDNNDHLRPEH